MRVSSHCWGEDLSVLAPRKNVDGSPPSTASLGSAFFGVVLVGLATTLGAGCEALDGAPEGATVRFDRHAESAGAHVFPSDLYASTEGPSLGVLAGFGAKPLAAMPFLDQLRVARAQGVAPGQPIRVPVSGGPPAAWVEDGAPGHSVADAVRLYALGDEGGGDAVRRLALAECSVRRGTHSLVCRPETPLTPGRYAVAVLAHRLRTFSGGELRASADYAAVQEQGDPTTDESFARVAAADPDISSRDDTVAYFEYTVADVIAETRALRDAVAGELPVWRPDLEAAAPITVTAYAGIGPGGRELAARAEHVSPGVQGVAAALAQAHLHLPSDVARESTRGVGVVVTGWLSSPHFLVADDRGSVDAPWLFATMRGRDATAPISADNPPVLDTRAPFHPLPYVAFFPAPSPPSGAPLDVVVAIHGFRLSKEVWASLAAAVCSSGRALIAIDNYQHGARQHDVPYPEGAFATKKDELLAGEGVSFPDPFLNPTFLARTRDKWRQSLLDQLALVRLLAAADGTRGEIDLDGDGVADHYGSISIVGQSLGGILGTTLAALEPRVARAVLSVPGGGLSGVARESRTLGTELDLLLLATAHAPDVGLLRDQTRNLIRGTDDRELLDAVVETILAPIDPLSFAPDLLSGRLRGGEPPRVLFQLAHDDPWIPNSASARLMRAVAVGAPAQGTFGLVLHDGQTEPLFPLGDVPAVAESASPPPSRVTEWEAGHEMIFDFVDPAVTRAAQRELVEFLDAP